MNFFQYMTTVNARYEPSDFHERIAWHVESWLCRRTPKLIINMPPRHGATEIVAGLVAWMYLFNRERPVVVSCYPSIMRPVQKRAEGYLPRMMELPGDDMTRGGVESRMIVDNPEVYSQRNCEDEPEILKYDHVLMFAARLGTDDLTARLIGSGGWETVSFPAIFDGCPLWPEKYGMDYLARARARMGEQDWLSIYQQRPSSPCPR